MCVDVVAGSSLQSMLGAVDNADVVLVCISRNYKHSPRCRTGQEISQQCLLHFRFKQIFQAAVEVKLVKLIHSAGQCSHHYCFSISLIYLSSLHFFPSVPLFSASWRAHQPAATAAAQTCRPPVRRRDEDADSQPAGSSGRR